MTVIEFHDEDARQLLVAFRKNKSIWLYSKQRGRVMATLHQDKNVLGGVCSILLILG